MHDSFLKKGWQFLGWLLLQWLLLRWLLFGWFLLRFLLLSWLLLRWLLLGWLFLIFNLNKTSLGETGCLDNPYFLRTGCLGIQLFNSPPSSQHSQLGYLWLPTTHCAALVWLTGNHAIPLVIKCFPSNLYPGKERISLRVTSILSMNLCSHT